MTVGEWSLVIFCGMLVVGLVVYLIWKKIYQLKSDNKELREDKELLRYLHETDEASIITGPFQSRNFDELAENLLPFNHREAGVRYMIRLKGDTAPSSGIYVVIDKALASRAQHFGEDLARSRTETEKRPSEFFYA